jgi:p-aminobenzoyl-glutamate transporter AbgT
MKKLLYWLDDNKKKIGKAITKFCILFVIYCLIGAIVSFLIWSVHPTFYGNEITVNELCFTVLGWPVVVLLYGIAHKG